MASEEEMCQNYSMTKKARKILEYRILITPDIRTGTNKKCFTAHVPVLGIVADGDTVEDARNNAEKLIAFHLDSLRKEDKPIPQEIGMDFITTAKVPA
ncbi:MAG TPA: type II toxin-antitoxin system HicB family antitoxin [Candidatus Paceibacterota bacterium]